MKKILMMLMLVCLLLGSAATAETMTGGWTPSEDPTITEELRSLVEQGTAELLGVTYVPVAYLGSQVVAGTNECFLCQATVVAPDTQPSYVLVYLYQDLQGNVTLMNIADFDFGALCEY